MVRALVRLDLGDEKLVSDKLKDIIVPDGVRLTINAIPVVQRDNYKSFHAVLDRSAWKYGIPARQHKQLFTESRVRGFKSLCKVST